MMKEFKVDFNEYVNNSDEAIRLSPRVIYITLPESKVRTSDDDSLTNLFRKIIIKKLRIPRDKIQGISWSEI